MKKGVAFRDAHKVVGEVVLKSAEVNKEFTELPLSELQGFCPAIEADVFKYLEIQECINRKDSVGGTAKSSVKTEIDRWTTLLS